jgi:hypothetical protein
VRTSIDAAVRPAGRPRPVTRAVDTAVAVASFAGYRHLAMRVIDQAVRDLTGPGGTPGDRASARAFLAGSPMLQLWCAVADVTPGSLVLTRRPRRSSAAAS